MSDKRNFFKLSFSLSITKEIEGTYTSSTELSISITESVPDGTDPVKFLHQRLSEEFHRKTDGVNLLLTTEEKEEQLL